MSARRAVGVLAATSTLVVAGAAGAYLGIYLYPWEWSRAIVSGIFFLAAELGLATGLVLGRLRRLEQQRSTPPGTEDHVRLALRDFRPAAPSPFEWLRGDRGTGVFVPILMGAGVVLSAVAFALQRIAEATTRAAVEPSLARDLTRLAPPPEGLRPDRAAPPPIPTPPVRRTGIRRALWVIGVVTAATLAVAGVNEIRDATESRPETADGVDTVAVIDVSSLRAGSVEDTVRALWEACRPRLTGRAHLVSVTAIDDDRAVVVLEPGLGDRRWRRFEGCVEDMTLVRVTASADRIERVTAGVAH